MRIIKPLVSRLLCLLLALPGLAAQSLSPVVARVTTASGTLNLRATPKANAKVITKLRPDTLVLVLGKEGEYSHISVQEQEGYVRTEFLTVTDDPPESLAYQPLKVGDRGEAVLALKERLQALGYLRPGAALTPHYTNDIAQRVKIFQRTHALEETGVASPGMQLLLFSGDAKKNQEELPAVKRMFTRAVNASDAGFDWAQYMRDNPGTCGCCMGEGCECCNFTGRIR